eukprot:TRINITY_DN6554_c0_g1_i2.p1 TRINITY_DN6554_c0_g1~~TRINITY_DN6554_c0_g1_i2.p1  ORF type:complete len:295 (+),score=12.48 TRINITY_DN6554_c0_g1_i2:102-986(+)
MEPDSEPPASASQTLDEALPPAPEANEAPEPPPPKPDNEEDQQPAEVEEDQPLPPKPDEEELAAPTAPVEEIRSPRGDMTAPGSMSNEPKTGIPTPLGDYYGIVEEGQWTSDPNCWLSTAIACKSIKLVCCGDKAKGVNPCCCPWGAACCYAVCCTGCTDFGKTAAVVLEKPDIVRSCCICYWFSMWCGTCGSIGSRAQVPCNPVICCPVGKVRHALRKRYGLPCQCWFCCGSTPCPCCDCIVGGWCMLCAVFQCVVCSVPVLSALCAMCHLLCALPCVPVSYTHLTLPTKRIV